MGNVEKYKELLWMVWWFCTYFRTKNTIFSNPSVVLVNLSVPKCFEKFCDPLCLNGNVGDGLWVGID